MLEELQAQIETQGSARARRYRLLKLILFGPVTHPGMNLLVIVSHRALAEMSAFWDEAEERVAQDRQVKCPVTLIVHTLPDVNRCLKDGAPFFCEIINQGILAYEDSEPGKDGHPNSWHKCGNVNSAKKADVARKFAEGFFDKKHQAPKKKDDEATPAAPIHVNVKEPPAAAEETAPGSLG